MHRELMPLARWLMIGLGAAFWVLVLPLHSGAAFPAQHLELDQASRWVGAKFDGRSQEPTYQPGYLVLHNHDPVQRNSRAGQPLNITGRQYTRGLYCHAASKLVVHLPGPGHKIRAVVGVDSNEQTRGGRGSVVFTIQAGGKELYRSPLMREGRRGEAVEVDLAGAKEFIMEAADGGDGIACDQADWADAHVVLADGGIVWLGDLPELGQVRSSFTTDLPFSFTLDGQPAAQALKGWKMERQQRKLDVQRTRHELRWSDPESALEVRCVAVAYKDFPTVEWTVYFKNNGTADSPLIENINALDSSFVRTMDGEFTLHYQTGSPYSVTDYQPHTTTMGAGASKRFAPNAGRSSDPWLPYFNLEWPGGGLLVAVGWPGQWAAQFTRDTTDGIRIRAGQETTRLRLHAGEEIRSPLMVLQFYEGDWIRGQNIWRRWMLAHNLPRVDGKLPPAQMAGCSSHQFAEMINANEGNQKQFIDRYFTEGLKLDYWWMDAGWYPNKNGWTDTGTWEVDTKRFPRGLRAITDHARGKGVRSILWFEPERVAPGTWLAQNRPQWVHGGKEGGLLDLGNDQARNWLTDHVDKMLTTQGIDLYRQDFNMDPLPAWRKSDHEDRQGITEIRHVTGYLAYWDELLRRHPNLRIDSCASGGRRNDLETLRRAVPLLRSDFILDPVAQQCHTYGIAFWMPYFGTGLNATDAYGFHSQMTPFLIACYDVRRTDLPYDWLRRMQGQWMEIKELYFGDYYPLTPYDTSSHSWMAWQFDKPEEGRGLVQCFRRAQSPFETARFKLRGLDPQAKYAMRNLNAPGTAQEMAGRELMDIGLPVTIGTQPGSIIITYHKK